LLEANANQTAFSSFEICPLRVKIALEMQSGARYFVAEISRTLSYKLPAVSTRLHQSLIEQSANLLIVEPLTSVKLIDFREAEKRIS
jgi:hypothetical protein